MKRCRQLARRSIAAWRPWLGGLLASVVLVSAPGDAADAPAPEPENSPETMTFQDDTLAVHVAGVPLEQLMAELSQLSGARVRWLTPRSAEPVTVEFPALPLSEALERLVGNKHFLLLYAPAGVGMRLTQIWISARDINQRTPQPGSKSAGALSLLPVKQPSSPTPGDQ